jgi:hypothetical protein
MRIRRPADIANVGSGKAHVLRRRTGERCNTTRMTERERHPHVDHVGNRQIGFVTKFFIERSVQMRLQPQNCLAVNWPIKSREQLFA